MEVHALVIQLKRTGLLYTGSLHNGLAQGRALFARPFDAPCYGAIGTCKDSLHVK
jgi:hypothetical protein